ncbi:hypothetical protein C0Q70_06516, partial [Pomacea canaliculata]
VDGHLINTGNDITYQVDPDFNPPFLISGGPLSYTYRVHYIKLHFGRVDQIGSEHTVSGKPFPLELQFLAFNKDLYSNYSHASKSPHGVAAVAVFGMVSTQLYPGLTLLMSCFSVCRTQPVAVRPVHPEPLPSTADYMTYEGSLTQPSCHETVTWIVFNKPVYVTKHELHEAPDGSRTEMLMEDNFRPTMALNRRTIRTNIAPKEPEPKCGVKKITFYEEMDVCVMRGIKLAEFIVARAMPHLPDLQGPCLQEGNNDKLRAAAADVGLNCAYQLRYRG